MQEIRLQSARLVEGGAKETQPESETWPEAKQDRKNTLTFPSSFPPGTTGRTYQRPAAREPCQSLPYGTEQGEGREWI